MMGQISSAVAKKPGLLSGVSFPEDQNELASYYDKLLERIEMANK